MIHLLALLLGIAAPAAQPQLQQLVRLVHIVQQQTSLPIYIGPVPPPMQLAVPESMAGISADAAYVMIRDGATDAEIAHELAHIVLLSEHYVGSRGQGAVPLSGAMAANLQDFILHPRLDRLTQSWQFPQSDLAAAHAARILDYLRTACDAETERRMGRIQLAGNALGLAEVLQRGMGPIDAIRQAASVHAPVALSLGTLLMERFPADPDITPAASFDRARQVLAFLDEQLATRTGPSPSAAIQLIDAPREPDIPPMLEQVIRAHWQSVRAQGSPDPRWILPQ
jgi:hypothetical protein